MIDITAKELLSAILNHMGVDFDKIEVEMNEHTLRLNIISQHSSLLIGYRGETVNSFQHLLKSMLWKELSEGADLLVIVDVDNYKKRQEDNLYELAERKAIRARETGEPQPMPPSMTSYQRRLVHTHFSVHPDFQDITTESIGEGEYRQLQIKRKD